MSDEATVQIAGVINSGSRFIAACVVYDPDGIAPTITTTHPGIGLPKIIEKHSFHTNLGGETYE